MVERLEEGGRLKRVEMVQVHLEACLPDIRVAPVKMIGGEDRGGLGKATKTYVRSRSARGSAGEEDVYEAEFGGPAERGASRASSRAKSRGVKEARAELLGLDETEGRNAVRVRELRSRSAARVREEVEVDVEMEEEEEEVSKSRSSSRMRGRGLKEKSNAEVVKDVGEMEPRTGSAARALRNGSDGLEVLYAGRNLQSTPRASSRAGTPRSRARILREQEESRAPPEVPGGEEFRSANVGRRSVVSSLDPEHEDGSFQSERISYRIPTRSPRSTRENGALPEERLLGVERLTRKAGRSPRKMAGDAVDMQVEPAVSQSERAPRRNVRKADLDLLEDEEDGTGLHRRGRVARQPKRKVRDIPRDPASMLPVSHPPECEMVDVAPVDLADPPLAPSSPTTSSRTSRGQ